MNKYFLFILIFLAGITTAYGQEDASMYMPGVYTPAPSSFVFATYGNIGMDNSSGAFNYAIPLYTLEYKDISLAISLGYQSNGLKVDELSSQVGTGWVLTAGGIVSRVMRGLPDEVTRWYPETLDKTQDETKRKILALGTGRNRTDTEQDWFSFHVNGISGSFYFDQDMNIHINSKEYLTIHHVRENGKIITFTLTDSKGYRYVFGGNPEFIEEVTTENIMEEVPTLISYNSSWFLREIISPTQNKMKFDYTDNIIYYDINGVSESLVFTQQENIYQPFRYKISCSIQTSTSKSRLLSRIYFEDNNREVLFNYSNDRSDGGGLRLENISVKDSQEVIREIDFGYSKIKGSGNLPDDITRSFGNYEYLYNRLFLDNIQFIDRKKDISEKYGFEYYDLNNLPGRFTHSKDKYGYPGYNNTSAFSTKALEAIKLYQLPSTAELLCTANLEVNPNRVYAGMLKKIIYPTGGYTTVEYEANSTMMPVTKTKEHRFGTSIATRCDNPVYGRLDTMVIKEHFKGNKMSIRIRSLYRPVTGCSKGDDGGASFLIKIRNKRTKNILFEHSASYSWTNSNTTAYTTDIEVSPMSNYIGDTLIFDMIASEPSLSGSANISCTWETTYREDDIVYAGGARVKEIIDHTGGQELKKTFYYNKLSEYPSGKSTIYVDKALSYNYARMSKYLIWKPTTGDFGYFIDRVRIYIYPYPLGYLYNNRSGLNHYQTITEITDGNGAVERTFKQANNTRGSVINGPQPFGVPPLSNRDDAIQGLPETEKIFKKEGSGYTLVNKKDYTYEKLYENRLKSYIMACMDMSVFINEKIENISITEYHNYIQVYKLKQVTDSLFHSNGSIANSKVFEYGIPPYYQLKKQTDKVSALENRISCYQYPYELTGEMPCMDKLTAMGRVGIPVVVEKKKQISGNAEKSLVSVKTEYGLFAGDRLVLPSSIYERTEDNPYKQKGVYDLYDEKGNLLQYTGLDGTPVSYLWSYNREYPVAKIAGVAYNNVVSVLGMPVENLSTASDPDMALVNALRHKLPSSLITTYTYKPLIGISTITDPTGITTYYEYDTFNRLKRIYMKENGTEKNIESYEYNYREQ